MIQLPDRTGAVLMLFCGVFLLSALAMVFLPPPAEAVSGGVIISPNGYEGFSLNAFNVTDVKAWNIYIEYNATAFTNPSVDVTPLLRQGSFSTDISSPGVITVNASSPGPLDYMGNLLHLGFDLSGENAGKIYSANLYVTRSNGAYEPVPVTIVNPPDLPPNTDNQPKDNEAAAPNNGTVAEPAKTPVVSPEQGPSSSGSKQEAGGGETVVVSPPNRGDGAGGVTKVIEGPLAAALLAEAKPAAFIRAKSVLDRFREFSTFTDEKLLISAFSGDPAGVFRQEPGVVLSNGKSCVTLSMKLEITGKRGPIFLLHGAGFNSLKMPKDDLWTLEVIPLPGVYEASVSAYYDDRITEFPLTVAPPLEWYLQKRTGKPEWGCLDYYVYIANILAKSAEGH